MEDTIPADNDDDAMMLSSSSPPPALSSAQMRAATLAAKYAGGLSLVGSSLIIWNVWHKKRHLKHRLKRPVLLNILLGMSLFDLCSSSMYIVGSWAIPANEASETVFMPRGSTFTCTAQGALFQAFEPAIPLYNLSLASYYYLTVKCNWKDDKLQRHARAFHVGPALFGLSTALYGVLDNQFHPNDFWCWFAGTEQSDLLKFLLYYIPIWASFFAVVTLFSLMYRHVRHQERANHRYQFERTLAQAAAATEPPPDDEDETDDLEDASSPTASLRRGSAWQRTIRNRLLVRQSGVRQGPQRRFSGRLSRPVLRQGVLYSCAFLLAFLFPTISRTQQLHKDDIRYGLLFCMCLCLPLQGFLNSLIYFQRDIGAFLLRRELWKRSECSSQYPSHAPHSSVFLRSTRMASRLSRWSNHAVPPPPLTGEGAADESYSSSCLMGEPPSGSTRDPPLWSTFSSSAQARQQQQQQSTVSLEHGPPEVDGVDDSSSSCLVSQNHLGQDLYLYVVAEEDEEEEEEENYEYDEPDQEMASSEPKETDASMKEDDLIEHGKNHKDEATRMESTSPSFNTTDETNEYPKDNLETVPSEEQTQTPLPMDQEPGIPNDLERGGSVALTDKCVERLDSLPLAIPTKALSCQVPGDLEKQKHGSDHERLSMDATLDTKEDDEEKKDEPEPTLDLL